MEKFPLNTPITKTNSSKSESVSSVVQLCPNLCNPMECSKPGLPVHHELPKLAQIHVHRVRDAIKPSHPLSSPSPPAFNLSQHQGLFNESVLCIRWPRVLEFQLQHQSFQWISGLISSRIDLFDLLEVQGTLKSILQVHSPSLLQDHSSKVSILCCSPFFIVQISYPYMTIGKTIALSRRTFVGNVMSLLFNMLSRLVITFLPRSKHLFISWLQSPSAVILEPPKSSLLLFPLFPHLFAMKWYDQMPSLND